VSKIVGYQSSWFFQSLSRRTIRVVAARAVQTRPVITRKLRNMVENMFQAVRKGFGLIQRAEMVTIMEIAAPMRDAVYHPKEG